MKLKSIPSCDLTKEFNGKTLYVKTDVVFCVKMKECHLLCKTNFCENAVDGW